ncbi:major histocompatibility complex class I-related gene protein-like [Scomber japonicus]|uniref:major histocompatibility complex class I-related gene protein-like n=1 Tax=Scomber japonicus TaxID=13676 RepID=UPI002305513A|nr:major histocompatibility complex class I-related gene protein-like [Scomber japonicus]
MKMLCFLVLLGLHSAAAVIHSMKCFITASSQVPNFPEFVAVAKVDDVQTEYYDSNIMKVVPKQDWMIRIMKDDPDYWKSLTKRRKDQQQLFKGYIETLKQHLNQTGGVHVLQMMYGCEWDDEPADIQNGFTCIGYDGEDFLSFDLKTGTWITLKQQAEITKLEWDTDKAKTICLKHYLNHRCPDYLEKFVNYGRNSLMRTDLPSVSLLQKTPSSPVSCFATGFYPNRAEMFWRKDGEKLHEDVELGEILPNHDGSFQMSVDLNLSSVTPEDWRRYECVFHLTGVRDIITKMDKTAIKTNWRKTGNDGGSLLGAVIGPVIVLLLLDFNQQKQLQTLQDHQLKFQFLTPLIQRFWIKWLLKLNGGGLRVEAAAAAVDACGQDLLGIS